MVSLLGLGLALKYNIISGTAPNKIGVGLVVAFICVVALIWALWQSKRESEEMKQIEATLEKAKG